jgi:hypothetical protein
MTKQELETQLSDLINKWDSKIPSLLDKEWCEYRVDKSKAVYLQEEIRKIEEQGTGELSCSETEKILML